MKKILILGASLMGLIMGGMGDRTPVRANPSEISDQSEVSETPKTASQEPDASSVISTQPVQITVLDPGAEPRQRLRLSSKVGEIQRSRMILTSQPTIAVDGKPFNGFDVPPIEIVSEAETLKAEPDGTIHIRLSFVETKIDETSEPPSVITSILKSQFEALSQASMFYVYDAQGRLLKADIQSLGENSESVKKLLKQLSSATQQSSGMFPDEPVGVGATWSAPQVASVNGLQIAQNIVYKLEDIQGDRVTLAMTLALDSEESQLDVANLFPLPPNVKAEVKSLDMTGAGTMTFSMSQLLATAMNLDNTIKMEMIFTEPDKATTITMDMISNLQILDE